MLKLADHHHYITFNLSYATRAGPSADGGLTRDKDFQYGGPMTNPAGDQGGWIGIDESGKGDYFGPLVIAGVYLKTGQVPAVLQLGVRDSKNLTDARILQIAPKIADQVLFSVVAIGPKRYNELYEKMKNLNRLLAWGHARVLENLLEQVPCARALSDQFGDERFILGALMKKGQQIRLEQRPRAESDPAVASASILARAEFLKRLAQLSQQVELPLPKGASKSVEEAARKLAQRDGKEALLQVAKWHFKTTRAVLA